MFAEEFDYDKVDWSNVFRKKFRVPSTKPMRGRGSTDLSMTNQEGEGVKEFLQEKIPQFLSSPVGKEISKGV